MADGELLVEQRDGLVRLTLANPERRNALTWRMYDGLAAACARINEDPRVRAVLLRGAGGRAFAAGTDIRQFTEFRSGEDGVAYERRIGQVLARLAAVRVPVVAVVEGPAVGAGLALAAYCDIVLATPDAVFGVPIAHTLGNCLTPAVISRLQRRLGHGRTMAMLVTATLLTAEEAAAAGLVAEVVPRTDLDDRVEALLARLAGGAPLTLAAFKEIDRRLAAFAGEVEADDVLRACYGSEDFATGVRAFLAHEPPRWTGR
ncbi:enoyl-CoA hydratase [Plantactinospora sp. CA-290183]|uniref:enoyl-CoA hydratase n=1 Tax=Plantactinospora sp. CA-290183 TaxID=3240006 RepID=UPI003D8ACFA7